MTLKNKLSACLLAACICFGSSAMAQEKEKEEQRIKLVYVKDGQKHILDETYTGEMSEALKKKIADFKAGMGGAEMQLHKGSEKEDNVFIFHSGDGDAAGVVTATVKQADGTTKLVERQFSNHQEMKEVIKTLKEEGDKLLTININIEKEETIEVEGDMEKGESEKSHLIVIKEGKKVLEETFEGKDIPADIQEKIGALKEDGKPLKIEVNVEAIKESISEHQGMHRMVIRGDKDASWKEINPDQIVEIKVTGEGDDKHIWIHKNGEDGDKESGKGEEYKYVVEEVVEGDSKKRIITVIVHSVVIEDITEKDKDIPNNLRVADKDAFGASMSDLNFYPNPNNGDFELKFNLTETGDTKIEVIDLSGKTIFVDELPSFSGSYSKRISLQGQPSGLYILKVAQNGRMMTKKIVVE